MLESFPSVSKIFPPHRPRTQRWADHFMWSDCGTQVIGATSTGRATVIALSLNTEFRMRARALWVEAGWHPPE